MRPYIKRIRTQNWQGRSFDHELAPFTAIIGDNQKGKTSLKNAIMVGLIGYKPGMSSLAKDMWQFAGAKEGASATAIELQLNTGTTATTIQRVWERKRGKVEYSTSEQADVIPPVLLDIEQEFFSLSGPKRDDFIFSKIDFSKLGFSANEIKVRLRKMTFENYTPEHEQVISDILETVTDLDRERVEFKWTYQQWIDAILEKIGEDKATSEQIIAGMTGLIVGTAQLATEVPAFDAKELKSEYAKLVDLKARAKNYESSLEKADEQSRNVCALTAAMEKIPDNSKAIAKLKMHIEELSAVVLMTSDLESSPDSKLKELESAVSLLREQQAARKEKRDYINSEIGERREALAMDKKKKCCPKCGSKSANWSKFLKAEEKAISNLIIEDSKLTDEWNSAARELEKHKKNIEHWKGVKEERENNVKKLARLNEELKRLQADSVTWREKRGNKFIDRTESQETARQLLVKMEEEFRGWPVDDHSEQIKATEAKIEELERAQRSYNAEIAKAAQAEEARQKASGAKAQNEVCKKAESEFKKMKAEMLEKGFGGFIGIVRQFTGGLLHDLDGQPINLEYRTGEIGYWYGATWVGLEMFSGTQKMLTLIGLAIALAQESPLKVVLIDEWMRDPETRKSVIERLRDLLAAGLIDQIFMIDTNGEGFPSDAKSVNLGGK